MRLDEGLMQLERKIFEAETGLSRLSKTPVIGTFAGATKVGMGVLQAITAIATAALTLIPAIIPIDNNPMRKAFVFSARHIVHGAGNMVAGVLEAMPIVQTILGFVRYSKENIGDAMENYIKTGQESRFIGYGLLAEKDTKPVSAYGDQCKRQLLSQEWEKKIELLNLENKPTEIPYAGSPCLMV